MRKIITLFIICLPFFVFSQKWHQYSDSIISNINKNDFDKAINFHQLAASEISKTKIKKDTLYADFLYAEGVLNYFEEKNSVNFLNESLDIWNKSSIKNYFKIMKIHYFLGASYYLLGKNSDNESDFTNSYNHYENCYLINKKYKLQKNNNFSAALYAMILIDRKINKDFKKVKKYADEYIELNQESALKNFDFNLINVYRSNNDFVGQEKVLQRFLFNYENEKLDEPKLLYNIYFELFNNNVSRKDKNNDFENFGDLIKYGEKAFNLLQSKNLEIDNRLQLIFMGLDLAFTQLGDNINSEKYKQFKEKYFPTNQGIDKYEDLKELIENEDYETFKKKFDEYEIELKSKNDYKRLADIYALSLDLYESNEIYKKEDILEKLNFIISNKSKLTTKEQMYFECTLVEFYSHANINLEEGLKICNKNLDEDDINIKLFFYKFKSIIETYLKKPQAKNTAYGYANKNYSLS